MTTLQLINTDVSAAYRKLITTAETAKQFTEYRNLYPLPAAPTTADFIAADKYALKKVFSL